MSFIGVEMTYAMDEDNDNFKEVNLNKEGKGSPRKEDENNTENKEVTSNKQEKRNTTIPPKTGEKKKCNIF